MLIESKVTMTLQWETQRNEATKRVWTSEDNERCRWKDELNLRSVSEGQNLSGSLRTPATSYALWSINYRVLKLFEHSIIQ